MRRHRKSLWASPVFSMMLSVILGMVSMAAGIVLSTTLIFFVLKDIRLTRALTGGAIALGAYISGFVYGKYRRRKGLFCGTFCGVVIYAVISSIGIIVIGHPVGIKKLLLLSVFGAEGGVAGVNSKRPKKLWDQ